MMFGVDLMVMDGGEFGGGRQGGCGFDDCGDEACVGVGDSVPRV